MGKKSQARVLQTTTAVVPTTPAGRIEKAKQALNETLVRTGAKPAKPTTTKPDDKPASALVSDSVRKAISAVPKTPMPTEPVKLPAAPNAGFRPAKFALNSTIHVMVAGNPKRPGTKAHAKWPLYQGANTVGDLIRAFVKAGYPKRRALSALRWDSGHGFIEIEDAQPAAKTA